MITKAAAADTKETRGNNIPMKIIDNDTDYVTRYHRKNKKTAKGEPPTYRGLQLSELEAPTTHFAALDKKMLSWFWKAGTVVHWSSRRRRD